MRREGCNIRLVRAIGFMGRDVSESVISVVYIFGKGEVRDRFVS
jgi:hypothetical protein